MARSRSVVLAVRNLAVSYRIRGQWRLAVRDLALTIERGQIHGLVGESGSGKSTVASAIMRCLPPAGRIAPQSIIGFLGEDLMKRPAHTMRFLWGRHLALIPQSPASALNPSLTIGQQAPESLVHHLGLDHRTARRRISDYLVRVNLTDPDRFLSCYPHQLSGGQIQRVLIAMAMALGPSLLILDEPTTALDVTTQAVILDLIRELTHQHDMAALYITHNLGVVAQLCQQVTVLYAGESMEQGSMQAVFETPINPYTQSLLASRPRLGVTRLARAPEPMSDNYPAAGFHQISGCVLVARCPLADGACEMRPGVTVVAHNHEVRCHHWQRAAVLGQSGESEEPVGETGAPASAGQELLQTDRLSKQFSPGRSLVEVLKGSQAVHRQAVKGVSLSITTGEALGLVGESGSGKTTLARLIVGLLEPSGGRMRLAGADLPGGLHHRRPEILSMLQMVFQDPQGSLNPYQSVREILSRPLRRLKSMTPQQAAGVAIHLLSLVKLPASYSRRFPGELSGGEKQRVAIARAIASSPSLIVCDEPVSALDASVQSSILSLLARLREELGMAYLLISHDLAVVGYLADRVAVMYMGELMEVVDSRDLLTAPWHPYTEALLSAIPPHDISRPLRKPIRLWNDLPGSLQRPAGCVFHTRCPHKLGMICEEEPPPWQSGARGRQIRCHYSMEDLTALQAVQQE